MSLPKDDAAVLSARWTEGVLLKRDVFSTVERGRFRGETARSTRCCAGSIRCRGGPISRRAICSPASAARWRWRAACMSGRNCCGPAGRRWCAASSTAWRCIWQNRSATSPISVPPSRRCAGCIAPASATTTSPRSRTGCAAATAAPISPTSSSRPASRRRSRLFRIAAYEDLRHLLKHKRSYAPEALTPKERKILARKSLVASIWLATGKKVYRAITRGLFNFTDREGGGRRLVNDAPVLIDLIRKNPDVRDTAIVAFADRRTGVGLYAFVEADQTALEAQLRNELAAAKGPKPPEHIQVVQALPRDAAGKPRTEILQLVAMNQLDLIEPMMTSETDRAFLMSILEQRKNLRDRFNFEAADVWHSRRRDACPHGTELT